MPDGSVQQFGQTRVAFLGGGWSKKTYEGRQFKAKHIPPDAVERLHNEAFDVLITHEAPGGLRFPGMEHAVGAPPIRALIEEKQPLLHIHGHHHQSMVSQIGATKVVSLCRLTPGARTESCIYPLEL